MDRVGAGRRSQGARQVRRGRRAGRDRQDGAARGGADGGGRGWNARASFARDRAGARFRLRRGTSAVRAVAGRGIRARARRSAARRCRRRGRSTRACGGTPNGRPALGGRRSLVRDPPRPLLAVREPGRRRPALPGGRRRAIGRRRVPPLPGLPAHAARRAGGRSRGGDPSS